jgi:hypothetical protein
VKFGPRPRLEYIHGVLPTLAVSKVEDFLGRGRLHPAEGTAGIYGPGGIEVALLGLEEEIGAEVLDSHTKGYSTTTSDLLHDLIP